MANIIVITAIAFLFGLTMALPFVPGARAATSWNVSIFNTAFNPNTLPIAVGDTVVWTNQDGFSHTVTSTDGTGELNSLTITSGSTYTHKFNNAGTFTYHCTIHLSMTGSVTVGTGVPELPSLALAVMGMLALVVGLVAIKNRQMSI